MENYVTLSLEKYNELYEAEKELKEIKMNNAVEDICDSFNEMVDNIKSIVKEEKWYIGQKVKVEDKIATIERLDRIGAYVEFDGKQYSGTYYEYEKLEPVESEKE